MHKPVLNIFTFSLLIQGKWFLVSRCPVISGLLNLVHLYITLHALLYTLHILFPKPSCHLSPTENVVVGVVYGIK